jgi:transcriptional regulator with XRE-family HTH domain
MDENFDLRNSDVGSRLTYLRNERGLSMRSLAKASGLSTNALSMIERSQSSPSISTLFKISEALGVPITAFFRDEPPLQDIVYCKASQRKQIQIPSGLWEGLGGESYKGNVEPFLFTLEPNASSGSQMMIHTGQEFVFCIRGELEYTVEDKKYRLEEGDNLIFSAHKQHSWRNSGKEQAQVIIIITGFEQGERPAEFHLPFGT